MTDVGDTAVSFVAIFKEQSGVRAGYFRELPEEATVAGTVEGAKNTLITAGQQQ